MKFKTVKLLIAFAFILAFQQGCERKGTDPDTASANKKPVAEFTYTEPTCVNCEITFDASVSSSPNGSISRYVWEFSDSSSLEGQVIVRKFSREEIVSIKLTVYDSEGVSATAGQDIAITADDGVLGKQSASCYYSLGRNRWKVGTKDFTFRFSKTLSSAWRDAAVRGMGAWHWTSNARISTYYYTQPVSISPGADKVNCITLGDIDGRGRILAQTRSWYNTATGIVFDADITIDRAENWSTSGQSGKFDLQSVVTHELGHVLRLADLYSTSAKQETMYGYTSASETIKRTLNCGDQLGAQAIYGYGVRRAKLAPSTSPDFSEPIQPSTLVSSQL